MKKFARIISDVAIDVCYNPTELFHPVIASEFVEVPDYIESGYSLKDGMWVAPVIQPEDIELPTAPESIKISPIDFKLLFTPVERVAVNEAKATDALINDFFSLIDDPRMTVIDLALQSTKDIIDHLVTVNILTPQRAEDILANKPV